MLLSDTAINRPVTTTLVTAGFLVFDYVAFKSMGLDMFPEADSQKNRRRKPAYPLAIQTIGGGGVLRYEVTRKTRR